MASPEIREWMKLAEAQGWSVTQRRNGHLQWRGPAGQIIHTNGPLSGSHNNGRAPANIRAQIEKGGVILDPRKEEPMATKGEVVRLASASVNADLRSDGAFNKAHLFAPTVESLSERIDDLSILLDNTAGAVNALIEMVEEQA